MTGITAAPARTVAGAAGRSLRAARGDLAVLRRVTVATPVGVAVAFAVLAVLSITGGARAEDTQRLLSTLPEVGLSLSAGLCAAAAVLADHDLDLQLSLPTSFVRTIARRLAVVLAVHGALAALVTALLQVVGWWTAPQGVAGAQLAWFAPTLWLLAVGALAGVATGERSAAAGILSVWWLVQNLFFPLLLPRPWTRTLLLFLTAHAPDATFWLSTRWWLVAQAAAVLAVLSALLRHPDRLLQRTA